MAQLKIRMPRFPDRQPQSFQIGDCSHLYHKLAYELQQFSKQDIDFFERGYLGLNIAMTAWHILDWLWYDMEQDKQLQNMATQILQTKISKKGDLAASLTLHCNALRICQVIATAGKHGKVTDRPDTTIETGFIRVDARNKDDSSQDLWVISYQGNNYVAEEVFLAVEMFWKEFLQKLGLILA